MSTPVLTVANQLTILRMGLSPVLVILVLGHELTWALVVFVIAGVTDLLDGLIARLGHQQTQLGVMLDPVADKLLLSSCFIVLTWAQELPQAIPSWLTIVVLSRDVALLVSAAIINLTLGRRDFHPSLLGKVSTACQLVTVGVVLLANAAGWRHDALRYLFLLTLVLTVGSALHYVYLASATKGGAPA